MGEKSPNSASMWQQYPPYQQTAYNHYQGYGQPGYGYPPNQYYGMGYQQGIGYPYGNGQVGPSGQMAAGHAGQLMPGFVPPGGSTDIDSKGSEKDSVMNSSPTKSSSGSAPGVDDDLPPLPPGSPPPPSNGLPPGFSPRPNNYFPNQVPNNPYGPVRFNINHKNRMQFQNLHQNQPPNQQFAPRPNAPINPNMLNMPVTGSKKKKKRAKLAQQLLESLLPLAQPTALLKASNLCQQ